MPRRLAGEKRKKTLNVQYDSPQQSAREGGGERGLGDVIGGGVGVIRESERKKKWRRSRRRRKRRRKREEKKKITWGGGVPAECDPW